MAHLRTTFVWLAASAALLGATGLAHQQGPSTHTSRAGSSLTLQAQADAWIDEGSPFANHGADSSLHIGLQERYGAPYNQQALVRFDLTALPADADIALAELRLTQTTASTSDPYDIMPAVITEPWTEAGVTWDNQPAAEEYGAPPASVEPAPGVKTWDVTGFVQAWAAGILVNSGILLVGDGVTPDLRTFSSREDAPPPTLTIEYTVPGSEQEVYLPLVVRKRTSP
jgi:hypothetical protein